MSAHDDAPGAGLLAASRPRLTAVLAITGTVLVAEVVGAILSGSLTLLADAGHMLTDVAGLTLGLVAVVLGRRPTTDARTWGFRRLEVLAAAAQAAVLLAVGGFVVVEAIIRLVSPPALEPGLMAVFGAVGLAGNLACLMVISGIRSSTFATRAAFLEVVSDALGSVAVLVAALVVGLTGWLRADPVASLLIGSLIIPRTISLLRDSVNVLMEATPEGMELARVRDHLLRVPHVSDVHDLHAMQVASGLPVLTVHAVVDDECFHDGHLMGMLDELQDCLAGHFDIEHSTIQFEAASHWEHERAAHR